MVVIRNTNAVVEHDCLLADCVHISPAASLAGGTVVGCGVWVGIGAVTKQSISIGQYAIVGAGAAVIHNVDAGVTVVGVPAKIVRVHGRKDEPVIHQEEEKREYYVNKLEQARDAMPLQAAMQ